MSVLRLRCSFSHLRSRRVVKHWLDKLLGWVVAINPLSFKLALSGVPVPLLGSLWYPSKNMLTYGGGGGIGFSKCTSSGLDSRPLDLCGVWGFSYRGLG